MAAEGWIWSVCRAVRGDAFTRRHQDTHLARLILHDWSRDGRFALFDLTGFHREVSAITLSDGRRQVVIRSSGTRRSSEVLS